MNTYPTHRVVAVLQRIGFGTLAGGCFYFSFALFFAPAWVNANPAAPKWASAAGALAMSSVPFVLGMLCLYGALRWRRARRTPKTNREYALQEARERGYRWEEVLTVERSATMKRDGIIWVAWTPSRHLPDGRTLPPMLCADEQP